jgi:hypothetical protein
MITTPQWIIDSIMLCTFAIYVGMAAVYFTTYLHDRRQAPAEADAPVPTTITPCPVEVLIVWTLPLYLGRAAVYYAIINHHRPFVFLEALAIVAASPAASFLVGQPAAIVLKTILLVGVSDEISMERKQQLLGLSQFVTVFLSCEALIAIMSALHLLAPGMF